MKSHHLTWICVLGTTTVAGLLLGGLAMRSPTESERTTFPTVEDAASFESHDSVDDFRVFPPVHVAELEQGIESFGSPRPEPPGVLPEPDDAAPLNPADDAQTTDAAPPATNPGLVRELIERELPNTTAAEREAWFEELKGLPPDSLTEVLRIRKYLGSIVPLPEPIATLPEPVVLEEPEPRPTFPVREFDPPRAPTTLTAEERYVLESSLEAIAAARRVRLNNLANAGTRGFLGAQPRLVDRPYDERPIEEDGNFSACPLGNGCVLAGSVIDPAPGEIVRTGRPLDVAIRGPGFLQFQAGGTVLYGRAGDLTLDADFRLVNHADVPIEPPVAFPREAEEIVVDATGEIRAHVTGSEPLVVGRVQLARFPNASGLVPVGHGLYEASPASGTPTIGSPGENGLGRLRSGALETSNVDVERERREIAKLDRQAAVLRELLGTDEATEPSYDDPSPRIAKPSESEGRQTSAEAPSGGPRLVVRPDMLPF